MTDENPTAPIPVGLPPAERIEEIARMLAGDVITDAARAAAGALLAAT